MPLLKAWLLSHLTRLYRLQLPPLWECGVLRQLTNPKETMNGTQTSFPLRLLGFATVRDFWGMWSPSCGGMATRYFVVSLNGLLRGFIWRRGLRAVTVGFGLACT